MNDRVEAAFCLSLCWSSGFVVKKLNMFILCLKASRKKTIYVDSGSPHDDNGLYRDHGHLAVELYRGKHGECQ